MSFILDALKKLEQKRQEGSVPDLMTVHLSSAQEPRKRPILPYIIVLALLINAGILAIVLLPDKSEKQEFVPSSVSGQQESAAAEDESKADKSNLLTSPASSDMVKSTAIENQITAEEASPVSHTPSIIAETDSVKSPEKEQSAPSESAQPGTIPEEPLNDTVPEGPVGLNPSPQEMVLLRETIKEEYASIDDAPDAEILAEEDTGRDAEKKVLEFDQLPSEIKKELPAISIKGHIYSNDASSRIVNVNGIIIREGDTVSAGLKVEEITMTGVIFDYGGLRFLLRAF